MGQITLCRSVHISALVSTGLLFSAWDSNATVLGTSQSAHVYTGTTCSFSLAGLTTIN